MATTTFTPSMLRGAGTRGVPEVPAGSSYSNTYSMAFDGSDDYIVSTLDLSGLSFSISFWMKSTDTTTDTKPICITNASINAPNSTLGRYYHNKGFMIQTYDNTGANFSNYYTDIDLNDGDWHNIIFTKVHDTTLANNKIYAYINGNNYVWTKWGGASTTPAVTWKPASIAPFIVGLFSRNSGTSTSYAWEGNLDEIVIKTGTIWNASDATDIYNSGVPKDMSSYSPTLWWRMGEKATWDGSNWTFTDQGSGGTNGTSANMVEADRETDVPS